ncbi:MAG: cytoplasmic protein [Deltaproteobacteria bacterium]|nr:cytoplasmic protein [Deltaproteobacteria bacterium]
MGKHSHNFVEEYDGLVAFGLDRKTDEYTLTYYLQKFSDDENIVLLRERMSEGDLRELFDLLTRLLKEYLSEEEYHRVFLKDETP